MTHHLIILNKTVQHLCNKDIFSTIIYYLKKTKQLHKIGYDIRSSLNDVVNHVHAEVVDLQW